MEEEQTIKTPFDVLLSALKEASEPLSISRLSEICGMPEREAVKWAHVLENAGLASIENRFNGVYVSWMGEAEEPVMAKKAEPKLSQTAVDVSTSPAFEAELAIAHQREKEMHGKLGPEKQGEERRAKVEVEDKETIDVGEERLVRLDGMIGRLKKSKGSKLLYAGQADVGPEPQPGEAGIGENKEENLIEAARRIASESEETVATEIEEKPKFPESQKDNISAEEVGKMLTMGEKELDEDEGIGGEIGEGASVPEGNDAAGEGLEEETPAVAPLPAKSVIKPKFRHISHKLMKRIERIKKPEPVQVTGVTLQFSERLSRQMKKIESQARAIDALRNEKEKLLNEHYLPLQNRLESEIETISDRVMRVQARVAGMQKAASDLPAKVSAVEQVQISSIKAHGQMRRAYDEACALLEETSRQLSEEREKMEIILEQSREELSRHSAMSGDLKSTMEKIEEMEDEAAQRVSLARTALSEQAERLAKAETHANELRGLRGEIGESVLQMKREVASAKRVLSDLESQMQQMRQVENYASTIRKDYDAKMSEIDDYIRNGNREFETLRESVEASFVRRYLRELRALSESYSFEFSQARRMESDVDARILEERKKLEQLFEESKKISYLFETQSQQPEGAEKFESHSGAFNTIDDVASKRTELAEMVAQVIGNRTSRVSVPSMPAQKKEAALIGITRVKARAKRAKQGKGRAGKTKASAIGKAAVKKKAGAHAPAKGKQRAKGKAMDAAARRRH
jgi:hypothetical protein